MSFTLGIRLLGGFSLTYGELPVAEVTSGQTPGVRLRRTQALLAYLVLNRRMAQSRQRIAFHLWPESTEDQARANLRKELSRLRQALPNPDEFLQVDAKTLQWLPEGNFTLDVAEFEAAVKATDQVSVKKSVRDILEQAIAHYRGELFPDLDDEWIQPERERLHQMYVQVLEQLVNVLTEQHDYPAALTHAQQLLRIDPLNEATYTTLMRLYGLTGDRAKALQMYHQCMTVLREELGVDPGSATRKLYEQLLMEDEIPDRSSSSNSHTTASSLSHTVLLPSAREADRSPLVGREQEWTLIQQWANSISFQPKDLSRNVSTTADLKVLLLVGEPGIGKTRLLEELRALGQANQAQVLWGIGFISEMMRPYGIWIDALRCSTIPSTVKPPPALGFLLPELGQPSQSPPDLSHLFDAVVQLLIQEANQAPLLVLLDDIQWMDDASSALLHYAIRLLRPLPVLFAFAARSGELTTNAAVSRVIQALRREQRLQTLELHPLDREQTTDLIRSTQAIAPSDLSLAVVNQVFIDSGGNPLFALEIARALGQNQPIQASTIETLIHDRLLQLEDTTREFLPWAAALGRSFKPSIVARVADYSVTKVLSAIDQLEQQGIIRPSTALSYEANSEIGYDFAHDIVRQVVYQQLSEPRRQLIHRQIAHQLQQNANEDDAIAGDIAHHASLGRDHALAASAALTAAERCLKLFAYAEALELAQQGIHHCQFLNLSNRISLQAGLLRIWALTGVTPDRAAQLEAEVQPLLNQAKSLNLNEAEATALETLIILQFDRNNYTALHQNVLRATEISQVMASPATSARMLAYSGSCLAEIGRDMIRAEALLLEAQALAARVGIELCDIFSGLGCVHCHYGRYDQARLYLQQALRLVQVKQDHWRECTYFSYLAMTELETGNPLAALPYCDEILAVAAKIQGEGSEATVATALAALAQYQLSYSDAEAKLSQAIAALQQVDAKRILAYVLIGAATVDLNQMQFELAVSRSEMALHTARIVNHPSEIALSWAILIQGLLKLGEHSHAMAQFEQFRQSIECYDLSVLAKTAVDRMQHQIEQHQPTIQPSR